MPLRFLFLLAFLVARPALAADCGPLKILTSVKMRPVVQGALRAVPVRVDGVMESFLLDTGGSLSQLTQDATRDLSLAIEPAHIRLYDIFGNSEAAQTEVRRLSVGTLEAGSVMLWITPSRESIAWRRSYFPRARRPWSGRMDGVLAADMMANYDIEMDFRAGMLKFISQDHCPGQVVYWDAANLAVVPMEFHNLQITVPVVLDGHPLTALIDTGAPHSTMSQDVARSLFGLSPGAGLIAAGRLGRTSEVYYRTRMRLLSFEGVRVDNPALDVIPDLMRPKSEAASAGPPVALPQLLLGMDVLSRLHLYIAFGEKRIYVTEASQ